MTNINQDFTELNTAHTELYFKQLDANREMLVIREKLRDTLILWVGEGANLKFIHTQIDKIKLTSATRGNYRSFFARYLKDNTLTYTNFMCVAKYFGTRDVLKVHSRLHKLNSNYTETDIKANFSAVSKNARESRLEKELQLSKDETEMYQRVATKISLKMVEQAKIIEKLRNQVKALIA